MIENPVRTTLLAGGSALGVMALEFFTPGLARVLAAGGAEFVILDTEHSGAGMDTLKSAIAYARGAGLAPLVRVPGLARHLISPVLDAGALGIMAPMLETAQQARELVSWCRYRPEGTRGLAFGVAMVVAIRAGESVRAIAHRPTLHFQHVGIVGVRSLDCTIRAGPIRPWTARPPIWSHRERVWPRARRSAGGG